MNTVLIAGASSGIGYALAKKFVTEGFSVLNISRTECVLAGVKNYLCDVSDEQKLLETIDKLTQENVEIDHFVYCIGCSMAAPVEYVETKDVRYLFEVNFFAYITLLQKVLPALRHNEGTACIISSVASAFPIPFDSYYSASKAAIDQFVFALQSELKAKNVKVISVLPWGVKTYFTYKRKVYPPSKIGDYDVAQDRATKRLFQIEQVKGENPEKVANRIYLLCISPLRNFRFSSSFRGKIILILSKMLPQWIKEKLIESKFLAE